MTNESLESMLHDAFAEYAAQQDEVLFAQLGDTHAFSRRFQKNMKRMLRKHHIGTSVLQSECTSRRRWLSGLIVLLIALAAGACTLPEVQAEIIDPCIQWFRTHVTFSYTEHASTESTGFDSGLRPGYLPEGYTLYNCVEGEDFIRLDYSNGKDQLYIDYGLSQEIIVDAEHRHAHPEFIDSFQGHLWLQVDSEHDNALQWEDDQYVFVILGNVDEQELVKIAESFYH